MDAELEDNYEYKFAANRWWVTNKPAWYAYYYARNLLLISSRTNQPVHVRALVCGRVLLEFFISALFRDQKLTRFRHLMSGLVDGFTFRSGKWRFP